MNFVSNSERWQKKQLIIRKSRKVERIRIKKKRERFRSFCGKSVIFFEDPKWDSALLYMYNNVALLLVRSILNHKGHDVHLLSLSLDLPENTEK